MKWLSEGASDVEMRQFGWEDQIKEAACEAAERRVGLPKPYYEDPGITIYHADCRDILPHLPEVDLVVTDPPYVFGIGSTEGKIGWGDLMNSSVWYASWLAECKRLTRAGSGSTWVFNSWRSFPVLARAAYDVRWPIESLLVWDKDWIGPGGVRGLRPQYELVALFIQPGFAIKNRNLPDVWRHKWMSTIGVTDHRAEKPVEIMERIIRESGARSVLDPFMGSGTTMIAARNLHKRYIGVEIEERWCATAVDRLRQQALPLEPSAPAPEQLALEAE